MLVARKETLRHTQEACMANDQIVRAPAERTCLGTAEAPAASSQIEIFSLLLTALSRPASVVGSLDPFPLSPNLIRTCPAGGLCAATIV